MAQPRHGARFAAEPLGRGRRGGELGAQHLHRDQAAERLLLGQEDHPHAPLAERAKQAVLTQTLEGQAGAVGRRGDPGSRDRRVDSRQQRQQPRRLDPALAAERGGLLRLPPQGRREVEVVELILLRALGLRVGVRHVPIVDLLRKEAVHGCEAGQIRPDGAHVGRSRNWRHSSRVLTSPVVSEYRAER